MFILMMIHLERLHYPPDCFSVSDLHLVCVCECASERESVRESVCVCAVLGQSFKPQSKIFKMFLLFI